MSQVVPSITSVRGQEEIDCLIRSCDEAFENPVAQRPGYAEFLQKIAAHALVFRAGSEEHWGYAVLYANRIDTKMAYLSELAVAPQYQGRRVGSALLSRCEEEARSRGFETLRLEVHSDNVRGIAFYEKHGFQKVGASDHGSFFMQKGLNQAYA